MFRERYHAREMERRIEKFRFVLPENFHRIPQEQVIDSVAGICQFYGLPLNMYERGRKIPAFITLQEYIDDLQGEAKDPNDQLSSVAVTQFPKNFRFVSLSKNAPPDQYQCLLSHELIHALQPIKYDGENEGIVSILELAARLKHLPFFEPNTHSKKQDSVVGHVLQGKEALSYPALTLPLITLMISTYDGSNPVTPQRLAKHYFFGGPQYQTDLEAELREKLPAAKYPEEQGFFSIFQPRETS